jgi:hypothetical protein
LPYEQGSIVRYQNLEDSTKSPDYDAKNTMEFYNCVVFIQETGAGGVKRIEFNDDKWHFYAIGNVGDSKKTDKTRLSDPNDPNEFCVEIMDWNRALSSFPQDTMVKAMDYPIKDGEGNIIGYKFIKPEYIGELYIKEENEYILIEEIGDEEDWKNYYIDILKLDDFSEDYTYGWRYIKDDEDSEIVNNCKNKWIEFYRFITQTVDDTNPDAINEWKQTFSNWFNLDAALYYFIFTLRYCMVDNRAKNSFWHYSKIPVKNSEGFWEYAKDDFGNYIYKFDFWDYDNDTALGIDNAGKLEIDYGIEEDDKDSSNEYYFRAAQSTFFQRVIKYFASELEAKYKEYETNNNNVFDSESLITEFDNWQNQFPEELWRLDYERKYKRPYVDGSGLEWDNAIARNSTDTSFLTNMMNGRKKYQRRQFERNQDFYMSSKFKGQRNFKDMIKLRSSGQTFPNRF